MRRRLVALGAALALALSSSLIAGGAADAEPKAEPRLRDALAAAPDDLKTPFETSNGASWTTYPESVRFLRDLDARSERVRVATIGRTGQNRAIQMTAVGLPAPQTVEAAAAGSVALFVCSVHGDENSGREACMQMARDLAFTTDAALTRFLRNTTVLFVNVNPDGWVADTRENAAGIDINRDYMALATPEAQALTKVIRDWNPDVLNDLHEYGPSQYYRTDLLHLWPRNRNVDPTLHDLAQQMSTDYSAAQVTSLGYTAGIYGQWVKDGEPFLQVAGDGQARILRNYAGLVNVVGMLSETANEPLDAAEEADATLLNRRRVAVNYASAVGSVQLVMEHRVQLAEQTAASAERNTAAGRERSGVVYFAGQDDMIPTSPNEVEPEPMCGYQLTAAQFTPDLRAKLRIHDITTTARAGGRFVSLAQPTRGLIPLLFDARSQFRILQAEPVETC